MERKSSIVKESDVFESVQQILDRNREKWENGRRPKFDSVIEIQYSTPLHSPSRPKTP